MNSEPYVTEGVFYVISILGKGNYNALNEQSLYLL